MSKRWGHINITPNRKQKFRWFGLIVEIDTLSESKKYDKMYPQCYNIPVLFYFCMCKGTDKSLSCTKAL